MPRGHDTRHDPRRQPLKPGDAGYALPSIAGLLRSMAEHPEREEYRDPVVEGMERQAWRNINEPD